MRASVVCFAVLWCAMSSIAQSPVEHRHSEEQYRTLAFAQYKQNDPQAALKTCEQGLAYYPRSQSLGSLFAVLFHETVPPQEQQPVLDDLLRQVPESPAYLKARGQTLMAADSENIFKRWYGRYGHA